MNSAWLRHTLALIVLALLLTASPAIGAVWLDSLRCEYKTDPVGIDTVQPRLSWKLRAQGRAVVQSAYQVQVAASAEALMAGQELVWDSGRTTSNQSIQVEYDGPRPESGKRYFWRVRVWDGDGSASKWSAAAYWEMGLLKTSDWQGEWISPDWDKDVTQPQPSPLLRTEFAIQGEIASARAYVTALGLYELELNGKRVGDQVLTPGWTAYKKRLQYQTFDVTELLRSGENAIGVMLGDGWYRGNIGWVGQRNVYGDRLALLMQIVVTRADGSVQVIASGKDWKASTGPVLMSDIYNGEIYDARLEKNNWSESGFDDRGWAGVRVVEQSKDILIAPAGPPVKRTGEVKPVKILTTPEGETVFDLGQNMVGWIRVRARGAAGSKVKLRHAEVLDKEGNFYTANLRTAKQQVEYTLKGDGVEEFEPRFTFQGFRYVAVDEFPGEPGLDSLTGIVVHSEMAQSGTFESSKPLLNQLQHNILWGQKGNFVDVPTDCPQRDERLGWTGDAQVFARTAAFNMDVASFFTKWLGDLAADQKEDGSVPHVVPDVLDRTGSAAWADASTIVPWTMYLSYGDKRILEQQYDSMVAWVGYMRREAGDNYLWQSGTHFGDWLAFAPARSDYPGATTSKDYIASAYFAHSTNLLARTAGVLGRDDDAREYGDLFERIQAAFLEEYVTASGRVGENTQTAYAVALQFDLLPESQRQQAAERLAANVREHGNHISTGFVGTSYLCPVLSRFGQLDVAYELLNQETYPSWLYPVKQGATTIWERWDGQKPDGTFQDVGMNSFNHYAYGAIGEWMYRVVAGLDTDPEEPGYKHVLIQPRPGGGLESARVTLETMYGEVESGWRRVGEVFELTVRIPPNTRATLRLPGARLASVSEGGRELTTAPGISESVQDGDDVVVEAGSGSYRFGYTMVR